MGVDDPDGCELAVGADGPAFMAAVKFAKKPLFDNTRPIRISAMK